MTTLVLAVGISILVSALCSLLESILYSTRSFTVEAALAGGDHRARQMRSFKSKVDRPLSAILILNTLANTAGAALAGWAAGQLWGGGSLWSFSLSFTAAILIFSEIIPKTVGAVHWPALWHWSVLPLQIITTICTPFIAMVRGLTKLITQGKSGAPTISEEEILAAARMGARDGQISQMESNLIQNIIMLEEVKATDIMTPRTVIFSLDGETPIPVAKRNCLKWPLTRVPVYMNHPEEVVGYVMKTDLLASQEDSSQMVKSLAKQIHFVPGSANALYLLNLFLRRREHIRMVVDEYGGIMGLVTLEDVLETLVGSEIVDESDNVADMQELARKRGAKVVNDANDNGNGGNG